MKKDPRYGQSPLTPMLRIIKLHLEAEKARKQLFIQSGRSYGKVATMEMLRNLFNKN